MPYEGEGVYRHYKGGLYVVLGIGLEEATLEPVVVYRPVDEPPSLMVELGATMFTRPMEDFNGRVEDVAWQRGATVPRFTKLSIAEVMETRNQRKLEWARFEARFECHDE